MVGPVLYLEMLLGGRRGRQLAFRYIYAGWLVVQLFFLWFIYFLDYQARTRWIGGFYIPDPNATSRFATGFVELFVIQQLILTVLITPAFAAGAITDEKTRGTLQYMLTAHLTAGEIVLGKLLARMAQVGLLMLTGLPVLCFIGVFGGLHPLMMVAVFVVTIAPVFALAAASLLASVWARQTRDAVLSLYAVGAGLLLLLWISRLLAFTMTAGLPAGGTPGVLLTALMGINHLGDYFNPIYVLRPGWESGNAAQLFGRLAGSMAVYGGVGAACLGVAVWRLRSAYLRQLESTGKRPVGDAAAAAGRAPVGEDPIRWKEREVEGIAPLATLRRIPLSMGIVIVFVITVLSSLTLLYLSLPATVTFGQVMHRLSRLDAMGIVRQIDGPGAGTRFLVQAIVAMLIASLVVGIRCSGTVSGERERQTWEALLLTPLEAKQLIRGKLWGIMGAAIPCLGAYAIPALVLSLLAGFQAFFWTVLWLAVTVLAMWYVGAAGISCSVSARSSWRALLGTLGFGYVGGIILYGCTQPIVWIIAGIIYIFLKLVDDLYNLGLTRAVGPFSEFFVAFFISSCLALAAIFYGVAWWFINNAEKRVADRERTRHWKDEPIFRPRRRAAPAPMRYY